MWKAMSTTRSLESDMKVTSTTQSLRGEVKVTSTTQSLKCEVEVTSTTQSLKGQRDPLVRRDLVLGEYDSTRPTRPSTALRY